MNIRPSTLRISSGPADTSTTTTSTGEREPAAKAATCDLTEAARKRSSSSFVSAVPMQKTRGGAAAIPSAVSCRDGAGDRSELEFGRGARRDAKKEAVVGDGSVVDCAAAEAVG